MIDQKIDQKRETVWLYGVVPAGAKLEELKRRRDRLPSDIRTIEIDDLAVIVGDPPPENDAKALRDQALAHARVLEAAVVDTPVVPFRFGMVVEDSGIGSEVLAARHDELAQTLEQVKDDFQFTVKAEYLEDVVLGEIIESQPTIAQLREQTRGLDEDATRDARVRLGELVSLALEEVRQRDASAIIERLKPVAVSFTIEPLESEFMVVNAPFLVERRRGEEFEDAVASVADEHAHHMHFTLLGPMPAYNFVGTGGPAWD